MNELLRQYIELTEVDHQLVQTREQLAQYPAKLTRMDAAEAADRKQLEALDADMKTTRLARIASEKEVESLRDKVKKYLSQQSAVKTNKEYEAITHEIEQGREKIDEWDSRGLELLIREESILDRRNAYKKKLEMTGAEHAAERERIQGQIEEKRARLAQLEGERAEKLKALEESDRDAYELLNEHFPGTACAPLIEDSCGGCHWHLVASTCQHVRTSEHLVECDHCRRILFAR